jgi:hypothetical protein
MIDPPRVLADVRLGDMNVVHVGYITESLHIAKAPTQPDTGSNSPNDHDLSLGS